MRIATFILVMIILTGLFTGQQVRENHGADYNITEAKNNLTWPGINISEANTSVGRIVYKASDAFGFIMFELVKESIGFGFENPQYDFQFMIDLWIKYIWISIAIMTFPFWIVCFAILVLISDIVKERIIKRRSKQ